ncbi:MAG: efflux RND transporter permease subunit, partial [Holophagales bacterium]|nr:efflux RND transporter permease subunit [Holophagales bacterium]
GLDGVASVRSQAVEGAGTLTIELETFAELERAKDDVETAVDSLTSFPPQGAEPPAITTPVITGSVVTLAVLGGVDALALRRAAEELERGLLEAPGVSLVTLEGARDYEVSIEVDEATLRAFGLRFDEVADAVRRSSLDLAAGSIDTVGGEIFLRVQEKRQTGLDFGSIVVRSTDGGGEVRLAELAEIRDEFARGEVENLFDGRPAIFVKVSRADAQDLFGVRAAVERFLATYEPPPGIEVRPLRDETDSLGERLDSLLTNGVFGFGLVFLFLVLVLDLKLAVWVSVGIATAFVGSFLLIGAVGVTLNQVSLFGLIIVLGLVVDDAIVIGESIGAARGAGGTGAETAVRGARAVLGPVVVGVATTIGAFSPLLVSGGGFGEVTRSIAVVVIAVLTMSLVEALLILPSHLGHGGAWSRPPLSTLQATTAAAVSFVADRIVLPVVAFTSRWRFATLGATAALLLFALSLLSQGAVRFIFFPVIEPDAISAEVRLPIGSPFERTREVVGRLASGAREVAAELEEEVGTPVFLSISTTAGGRVSGDGGPGDSGGFTRAENLGQVQIELAPSGSRSLTAAQLEERWRERVGPVEGVDRLVYNSTFADFGADVEFELSHADSEKLLGAVEALKVGLAGLPGVYEISDSLELGQRELLFELEPAGRAAGLRPREVARQVRQAYFGEEVQRIQRQGEEVRVYLRYPERDRTGFEALDALRIRLPEGGEAPLFTVARARDGRAFASIERVDGRRVVTVSADVDEARSTPGEANAAVLTEVLPELEAAFPGLRWRQAGAAQEQNEDFASLGRAFLIVLLVIYAIVATQLRSYFQPFAILAAVPLALAGALFGHWALGYPLSFVSIFGIVALAGVSVNASVVLLDEWNRNRRRGADPLVAAASASARRFRPVMLTTLTTALGLAPLLFETSPQSQFLIPMAVSLGFGILISGALVLIVTPAVALVLHDLERLLRLR